MDTMTEHWGHLIGRTLEPPPGEDDGESPAGAAAPVAAGDADGGSTTGEGDGSCTLDDDVTNGDGAGARVGILRFLLPVMEPPPMVSLMGILPLVLPFLRLVMELPAMLKVMGILCLLPLVVLLLCHRR